MRGTFGVVMTVVAIAACGGGGDGGGTGPSLTIAKAVGDGLSGPVATQLGTQLQVLVTDNGTPKQGVAVTWTTPGGGASVAPSTPTTDAQGHASATVTMGQVAGPVQVKAAITGTAVTFNLTANPGPAAIIVITQGDDQAAKRDSTLTKALQVRVTDQFGNVVNGVVVGWSVSSGSALLGSSTSNTANGLASNTLTVGSVAGLIQVTATIPTNQNQVTFTAHAVTLVKDVLVKNNFFESVSNGSAPLANDTIPVGEAVRWIWSAGSVTHNILPDGSPALQGVTGSNDAPFTHGPVYFDTPGTYNYLCNLHAGMMGVVVVQ